MDAGALGRLGYAQELLRRMGGFSSFAWIAVVWSAAVLVVCSQPPNQLPATMLAGAVVVLATL